MMVSRYFSLAETTITQQRGINNSYAADKDIGFAIGRTAQYMDMVRDALGGPVVVSSWYRSPELNAKVGGSKTSQHMKGEAVDFICPSYGSPMAIVKFLEKIKTLPFDQMIMEGTWVHISFCAHPDNTRKPRRQVIYL